MRAGLTDILIITGRGKHAIEDHFDRNFELEFYLEQKGTRRPAQGGPGDLGPRQHPLHPPEGPARSRARGVHRARARGQRAVRGAARRRHHGRRLPAPPLDARRARPVRTVGARADGGDRWTRSRRYGCVEPEAVEDELVRVRLDRGEAEEGRRAVEPRGHRSVRVHAADLRRARPHRAGRRRRAPAHRRDRAAQRDPDGLRPPVHGRPLRHRAEGRTSSAPTSSSRSTGPTSAPSSQVHMLDALRRRGIID